MPSGDGVLLPRQPLDPLLRLAQIIAVQTFYYLVFGMSLFIVDWMVLGRDEQAQSAVARLFTPARCGVSDLPAIVCFGSALTAAVAVALFLPRVVERARECLDFCGTLFGLHALFCWAASGIPRSLAWWLQLLACTALSTVISELLCVKREMRDILIVHAAPENAP